jgi:hypothetical protein
MIGVEHDGGQTCCVGIIDRMDERFMDEHFHQGDDGCPLTDSVPEPRRGWLEAFQRMAENGNDALLTARCAALRRGMRRSGNGNRVLHLESVLDAVVAEQPAGVEVPQSRS